MADDEDSKVTPLPVRFKKQDAEPRILLVEPSKCLHMRGPYKIDDSLAEVTCGECGDKLNPIWVLKRMAAKDSVFQQSARRYQDEMKRLEERSRTKCEYCGQMTRISRR
jgi:hypothetical protein